MDVKHLMIGNACMDSTVTYVFLRLYNSVVSHFFFFYFPFMTFVCFFKTVGALICIVSLG